MPTGKGVLRIAIEDFIEGFKVGDRVENWIDKQGNKLRSGGFGNSWKTVLSHLGVDGNLPDLFSQNSPGAILALPALIPMLIGALIGLGFSFISVLIQPVALLAQYQVNKRWSAYRIDPRSLAALLKSFPENTPDWLSQLLDLGVDEKTLTGLQGLNINRLQPLQYIALWRRGLLSDVELDNQLSRQAMLSTDIERIKQLTEIIPTPNDLIFLSVKEAFDDDLSSRFNHDEGFPDAFGEWAVKQGLSLEWAHRYWRAHWNLPSFQQVAEMFQRLRPGKSSNVVSSDDVNQFLKMADYSPFWRERLKEIAYSPFTRVDIRRMYKVGVLDEQQVKEAYKDIGYNDEKSQALTEFTTIHEAEEETGIVRSSVLSAYGDGMIDRATAESMLSTGGYDATTIAFYLDNEDFKEALEVNKIKMANIKKRFIEGLIDETTVNTEINMLNLPAERVTALLELWITERENQTSLLSITQMEVLLEKGIVTEADYRRVVERRGYTSETIEWSLKRIALEASEKAQITAEKAEADNERLQKSKTTSQYQKDKSEIDLAIAQAKAEITDIDVALHGEISPDDITTLTSRKDELKSFIAQMNVTKAQLKFDIQSNLNKLTG